MEAIRALGFNSIRSWVDWAGAEPVRGRYRFEALDQILELAGETGLKVVLQVFPDPQPDWLGNQYPDARIAGDVDASAGQRSDGSCIDHPGVREDLRALIAAVSARAARSGSFYAIDPWGVSRSGSACVCSHTVRRFREWLQGKYRTLDALNAAWHRSFAEWSEIDAPDTEPAASLADLIDWGAFHAIKRQEDLLFLTRASAPRGPHPTTGHSFPSVLAKPFSILNVDEWRLGGAVDYYGSALYPKPAANGSPYSAGHLGAALDSIRSAGRDRGWWLAALQSGQAVAGSAVAAPVTPADLRVWSWAALSRGARAIFYYAWYPMSAGSEAGAFGLVDLDGTLTERARAAGAFAGIVSRNPALFAPLRPGRSAAAILYNPSSWHALGRRPSGAPDPRDSVLGVYRALFARNIQADFVHASEIAAGGAAAYRAIFLPAPLVMDEALAAALASYVRSGGTLVSEARPAWRDEQGRANARVPGFGLDEVFGAREKEVRPVDDVELSMERELDGPLSTLAGKTVRGAAYAESLEITGPSVRVIARFRGADGAPGDPAIVASRHGSGRAVLIGSLTGTALEKDPDAVRTSGDLLAALAAGAGAQPDVRLSGSTHLVETRFLESSAVTVLIAINHADAEQKVTMTFPRDTPEAIWLNLETGASVNFVAGPEGPIYTHLFAPRDVLALMIKKDLR
jgi:beta-galactosidase